MEPASKSQISELQAIITKMPLALCCVTVLSKFGVQWRELSRAVRNSRLPMQPASVAKVLCRHAAKTMTADELDDVLSKLRLKLVATQERKWHVINLIEPVEEQMSVAHLIRALPSRVAQQLRRTRAGHNKRPEVQTVLLDELIYISVQMTSETKKSPALYLATPPGQPVALVSSPKSSLLKACVLGIGYNSFVDSKLFGRDIQSLLRINNGSWNENVDHLTSIPEYFPIPIVTKNGIDYTHKTYDEQYVENIIGPDPPVLNEIILTTTKPFFDPSRLNKVMTIRVHLKSDNVIDTLKSWVSKGVVAPTSDIFQMFHKIKSNNVECVDDE